MTALEATERAALGHFLDRVIALVNENAEAIQRSARRSARTAATKRARRVS